MSAATRPATDDPMTPARRPGRALNVVLWVLQVLLALGIVGAAISKFTGAAPSVQSFDALGAGDWLRYTVAVLELLGAAGLLIPRLTGLAAAALSLLLVGAVLTQAFAVGAGVLVPVPYLVVALVIAWFRRDSLVRLAGMRRRS